jgi:DNA-nicking Smr family endonuclease
MSADDENKDRNSLDDEDQAEWDEFTQEFSEELREEENFEALLKSENFQHDEISSNQKNSVIEEKTPPKKTERKQFQNPQLDKRTFEKLRKGKLPIEARLDLHGMNKEKAHEAVTHFIKGSYAWGLRTLIIITGKGKSKSKAEDWLVKGQGVLKENVPYWLESKNLKPYILKFVTAQPKDGGSGALYIYLKRKR